MTPTFSRNDRNKFKLRNQKGRKVIADFSGGRITSNAGIVLMAELDRRLKITARFAQCFLDHRHPSYIDYSVHNLLAQRIYGLILGYEDLNDHDHLRDDPALAIALEKLNFLESDRKGLAGKSTLNRLEYCPDTVIEQSQARYHKIEVLPQEIEKAFVEIFLNSYLKPPKRIILDLDVTDDEVHGNQEGAAFNKYYGSVCYAPLYVFCGHHLLVDYVLAMATNNQLKLRASHVIEKARADYEQRLKPAHELLDSLGFKKEELETVRKLVPNAIWDRSLCYKTEKSWSRTRRVVTKVSYGDEGLKMRHVVTSLSA